MWIKFCFIWGGQNKVSFYYKSWGGRGVVIWWQTVTFTGNSVLQLPYWELRVFLGSGSWPLRGPADLLMRRVLSGFKNVRSVGLDSEGYADHLFGISHQCCNRAKISRNIPVIRECTQVPSLLKQRCKRSPVFNPATSPNVFPSPSHPDPTKRRPLSWPLVIPRERSSKARRIFPWIRLAFTRATPCHHLPSFPSVHSRVCFLGLFSLPAFLYLVPNYCG